MDTINNKTYEVITYTVLPAHSAAAERKNPLISPIAIFAPHSTLDNFEGEE